MALEIRPVRDDELDQFQAVPDYVFANSLSDEARAERPRLRAEWTLAAFVDGRLATSLAAWPFRVRLDGASVRMAGVTMVGTYPEYRRQGLLRAVMTRALSDYRDAGKALAILWASMGAIYQRFGYGLASTHATYDVDPRDLSFQWGDRPAGRVQLTAVEAARPTLESVYASFAAGRNLVIDRAGGLWDATLRPQGGSGTRLHAAIYSDGAGTPRGYVVFSLESKPARGEPPGPDQVLTVQDWAALDVEAHRALWEFCAAHDLVRRVTWQSAPEDDPIPLLLQEPRQLHRRTMDGIWMRVTDVAGALPLRPYGEAGMITIAVRDALCPWNEGVFVLETTGTETRADRLDDSAGSGAAADLSMGVHALAGLLAGHRSATALARAGLVTPSSDKALLAADRMFATGYAPWCPNGF